MKNLTRLIVLVLLIGSSFAVCADAPTAQDCPFSERGWFIRIIPEQTEAPGVRIEIGFGGVGSSHQPWREWRPGQPTEFPVPTKFLHANEIWIKGISLEEDKNVAMCVGFNDHITQKMCFDADEEHETSRDDSDGCNCD
jgi:hypothetical protein